MSIDNNISDYGIYTENEVSRVLYHFNMDYIISVTQDSIKNRYDDLALPKPNVVSAMENFYKSCILEYPAMEAEIKEERNKNYFKIIEILCEKFNISINLDGVEDIYSVALYLYALTVSNFSNNIVAFFTNFINKEKNSIYESMHLTELKKNKDVSTIYNKKVFKNSKLAIINSNLEHVIDNICTFDISFSDILDNIFIDKNVSKYLDTVLSANGNYFNDNIVLMVKDQWARPTIITNIKFELQKLDATDMDISEAIKN